MQQAERVVIERKPEDVLRQTCPLYDMKYEDQIKSKEEQLAQMLAKFRSESVISPISLDTYLNKLHRDEQKPDWITNLKDLVVPVRHPSSYLIACSCRSAVPPKLQEQV